MKTSILFFLIFLSVGFYFFRILTTDQSPVSYAKSIDDFSKVGVPTFALKAFEAKNKDFSHDIDLTQFHDKVMLINFWATWCVPCTEEFPQLIKLAKRHQSKDELEVFAVSLDKDPSSVKKFMSTQATFPSNFHVLLDSDGAVAHHYGTRKIPETYIVDSDHKLLKKALGDQNWLSEDFQSLIKSFGEKRSL